MRELRNKPAKFSPVFSVSQSETDLALLVAIQNHLNELIVTSATEEALAEGRIKYLLFPASPSTTDKDSGQEVRKFAHLSSSVCKKTNIRKYNLAIQDSSFLKDILIPYFDLLVFRTKKGLDYQD